MGIFKAIGTKNYHGYFSSLFGENLKDCIAGIFKGWGQTVR